METLSNISQKPNGLSSKMPSGKIRNIDKISLARLSFKFLHNDQKYIDKLKRLPKAHYQGTYTRKIFKNGIMKSDRVMSNKMKVQYYGAFSLQKESEQQEWERGIAGTLLAFSQK